jgi:hypothetical protein
VPAGAALGALLEEGHEGGAGGELCLKKGMTRWVHVAGVLQLRGTHIQQQQQQLELALAQLSSRWGRPFTRQPPRRARARCCAAGGCSPVVWRNTVAGGMSTVRQTNMRSASPAVGAQHTQKRSPPACQTARAW